MSEQGFKCCKACNCALPKTEFYSKKGNKDGLCNICIDCTYKAEGRARPLPRFRKSLTPGMKLCNRCNQEYPATTEHFERNDQRKDGLNLWCRSCRREYGARLRRKKGQTPKSLFWDEDGNRICSKCKTAYPHTAEFFKVAKRKPGSICRVCDRKYKRELIRKNPEKYREISRALSRSEKGRINNRFRAKIHGAKRRAKVSELPTSLDTSTWNKCLEYWGHCCAICNRPRGLWHTLAMDHWIPVSDPNCPGTVAENILPLCHGIGGCNNMKSNRNPLIWLKDRLGSRKFNRKLAEITNYFELVKKDE